MLSSLYFDKKKMIGTQARNLWLNAKVKWKYGFNEEKSQIQERVISKLINIGTQELVDII